jgi:hypothetical protein
MIGMEYHRYTEEEKTKFRDDATVLLAMRKEMERSLIHGFPVLIYGSAMSKQARDDMTRMMKQRINNDKLAEKLIPDFDVGCRRLTVRLPLLKPGWWLFC